MSIAVNAKNDVFLLSTDSTSYAFGIDDQGLVRHLYWGKKLLSAEELEMPQLTEVSTNDPVFEITPEEFPVHGGLRYKEHCLKAAFTDGTRELVYQYCGYDVEQTEEGEELIVHLKDDHYDFFMDLHYKLYPAYDLMERSVVLRNQTSDPIAIEKIHSGQFHIPYENLNFSNVHGHWGAEQQRFVQRVNYGKIVIENRRGISTHNHNPYFVLDRDATETAGDVYFGALRLSGNFSGVVEQTQYGETLVQMGLNPHDCVLQLQPGETFTAPGILFGYSGSGFETMSHNLHRYARDRILRKGCRPVLYNSWEATEFHVNSRDQINLARKAAELGAELFVLDDGWFGERHSIQNGLAAFRIQRQSVLLDCKGEMKKYHKFFYDRNVPVDVIPWDRDFAGYKVLILPQMIVTKPELQQRLRAFAEKGGTVVLTYRDFVKDSHNNLVLGKQIPLDFDDFTGVCVVETESLQEGQEFPLQGEGEFADLHGQGSIFRDMLAPQGAQVLLRYQDPFYQEFAAVTRKRCKDGDVYYLGCGLEEEVLDRLMETISRRQNISLALSEPGVEVVYRGTGADRICMVMNHNAREVTYNGQTLAPFQCCISPAAE